MAKAKTKKVETTEGKEVRIPLEVESILRGAQQAGYPVYKIQQSYAINTGDNVQLVTMTEDGYNVKTLSMEEALHAAFVLAKADRLY